ncbi:MAG: hypothetical protein K0R41_828 [Geminicoccaceae bacterium]|jgi:uncharacterized membrane protein|nr:hypothetical protein [Geminicoccaceae bacterium]MDF2766275.1 hypothetical protein [Rhodospirillales bacterium]
MNRTALLSVAGALAGAVAMAQATAPAEAAEGVKCYGISAAGQNDCANEAAGHSCAGMSEVDYDGMDFKAVEDEEACLAENGKLEPFEGQNPEKT